MEIGQQEATAHDSVRGVQQMSVYKLGVKYIA